MAATVVLSDQPWIRDAVVIENISDHGARIRGHRALQVHDHLVLTAAIADLQVFSEVVYCHGLGNNQYAVGLKFISV